MTGSAKRIWTTIVQWVFPWKLHNCWIKIKCILLQNQKQGLNQLPEGKTKHTMKSLPRWMQQKSKVGGLLHKYSTIVSSGYTNNIVALITWSGCHICAQQPQLLPKEENKCVHTLEKTSYPLSSANIDHDACAWSRDSVLCLNPFTWIVIFAGLIYLHFSVNPCLI